MKPTFSLGRQSAPTLRPASGLSWPWGDAYLARLNARIYFLYALWIFSNWLLDFCRAVFIFEVTVLDFLYSAKHKSNNYFCIRSVKPSLQKRGQYQKLPSSGIHWPVVR
jgi:hypothetical protein